jgi:hypothetical protein
MIVIPVQTGIHSLFCPHANPPAPFKKGYELGFSYYLHNTYTIFSPFLKGGLRGILKNFTLDVIFSCFNCYTIIRNYIL